MRHAIRQSSNRVGGGGGGVGGELGSALCDLPASDAY